MERREKVDFILEQMRLCLAKKDYIRTQIISKKISPKFFENNQEQVCTQSSSFVFFSRVQVPLALLQLCTFVFYRNPGVHSRAVLIKAVSQELDSWGPFLESPKNFSGPKSQSKHCDPLILKSWSFTMISRYESANLLQNFIPGNVFLF